MVEKAKIKDKITEKKQRAVLFYVFEGLIIVFVLALLAVAGLLVSVSLKPLDLNFAKPFIEKSLADKGSGLHAKSDKIFLYWPNIKSPLLLALENARVFDGDNKTIVSVDEAIIGLSALPLFTGQVKPNALILKKPTLRVTRKGSGEVSVDFGGKTAIKPQTPAQERAQTSLVQHIVEYVTNPEGQSSASPLSALRQFKIEQADVIVEDNLYNLEWGIPHFNITFQNTGHGMRATFKSNDGQIYLPEFYDSALPFQDLNFVVEYDHDTQSATLENTKITIQGAPIKITGALDIQSEKIVGQTTIVMPEIAQSTVKDLWPKGLEDDPITQWLTDKINGGTYKDLSLSGNMRAEKKDGAWGIALEDAKGTFSFSDTTIRYLDRLTPATKTFGQGVFDYGEESLMVDVARGMLSKQTITEAKIKLKSIIKAGTGTADINIPLSGPVADIFDFVAQKRIGANHGFDTSKVKGQADYTVNLKFPTTPDVTIGDVDIVMNGKITGAYLPNVVGTLDLSGGTYDASIKNGSLFVKGTGKLDGRAAKISYEQFLDSTGKSYESKINANVTGDLNLLNKLGADLSDFIKGGTFKTDVAYTDLAGGKSTANITADITDTVFTVEPFKYTKPAGSAGSVDLNLAMNGNNVSKITGLNINAPNAYLKNGTLTFNSKGEISGGTLPSYKIYDSTGSIGFTMPSKTKMTLDVRGEFLDLTPFLEGGGGTDNTAKSISVDVKKMLTSPGQTVRNAKILADLDAAGRFNRLEMDALAGQAALYIRFKPDSAGQKYFRLEADDAGGALKAFGIYDKIKGGRLVIYGAPNDGIGDRDIAGSAELSDFKVKKAPAIAKLINALSLPGLLKTLDGEGMTFAKMESDFKWDYDPKGSVLHLENGRTSGNSLGLTFDGDINNSAKIMDINGTLIPMSGINKFIGSIPLIGDILTGGTGSLIAMTYKVKGSTEDPSVSVNPLSALTPGLLRRILFEEGD